MVDLSDLLDDDEEAILHPREIFLTLDRAPAFQFPRDIQTEIMNAWFETRDQRDSIIKLNVGGGKTLVGLLLLQSCLNEGVGPALYVCPDNQLVSQVLDEACELGIETTEDPKDAGFQAGQRICVTNVHKVFNGRSVFGVGQEGIKIPIGSVVVDDAHACLATINDQFKISLKNTHPAYKKIFELMQEALKAQARPRFLDLRDGDPRAVIEVPFWAWQDKADDILEALHAERESDELLFSYPLLREVLPLCRCIIGGQHLEIEPIFPPSDLIKSFAKAKRRIYMTATLSDDSVLSTHFAADADKLKAPIVPKSSQSMGERMILVPQDTNADLEIDDIRQLLVDIAEDHNVVVIVPSDKSARLWKNDAHQILTSKNIVAGVDKLREGHVGLTVLINRYDGIDLPGNACRVLAIFDLPEVTSFREAADHAVLSTTDATLRRLVCSLKSGPLFELVPASDMELRHGQEIYA
jgi:replicative superfamily II helicase